MDDYWHGQKTCTNCQGTGLDRNQTCKSCHGTGKVPMSFNIPDFRGY